MADTHIHVYPSAAQQAASDVQAAGYTVTAPDAETPESNIVQAAAVIAAAFIARNFEKHGDRGQYSLDTIVRMSVETAEKIHTAVHSTE